MGYLIRKFLIKKSETGLRKKAFYQKPNLQKGKNPTLLQKKVLITEFILTRGLIQKEILIKF